MQNGEDDCPPLLPPFLISKGASSGVEYTSGDFAKQWSFSSILNGTQLQTIENIGKPSSMSKTTHQQDRCRKLLQTVERCLKEGINYYQGVDLCNEILDGHDCSTDPILKHDCLCAHK